MAAAAGRGGRVRALRQGAHRGGGLGGGRRCWAAGPWSRRRRYCCCLHTPLPPPTAVRGRRRRGAGRRPRAGRGAGGAACPCWDAMVEDPKLHPSTRGEARRRREERRASRHFCIPNVKVEDDKTQGHFCIYSCPLKGYGPKWNNLTSSGSQISILRVRGPKWHLGISSRAAGVFNSFFFK